MALNELIFLSIPMINVTVLPMTGHGMTTTLSQLLYDLF